jgi:hypothetical protein
MTPEQAFDQIRLFLTPDLLKASYRAKQQAGAHHMTGHCFVAAEALYHLMGGKGSGFIPHVGHVDSGTHWWVVGPDGGIWDPTFDQFDHPVDYASGRGTGFGVPGGGPSKRTQELMRRIRRLRPAL